MTLRNILLFGFLTIFTTCKGQVKIKATEDPIISEPGPTVIKNFKAVAVAPSFDTTLVSQYIRSIFQDSKGNMWFGTIGEGVVRYDKKTLTYFSTSDGFKNNTVYAINEDKSGNIWLGTDQGVYKYDGKTFRNYNQKDGLSHLDITRKGILVDQSGTVWVGTHGGVFRYDPVADGQGRQSFSLFQALPAINVAGMLEDHNGNIWIASASQGVFRYDPSAHFGSAQHKSLRADGKTITHIAEKDALGDNYAGGIAEDQAGNIWFTMKNGICKYDPSASLRAGPSAESKADTSASLRAGPSAESKAGGKMFTEYTPKDGLGGTEFWGIYIEQSGIIWVTARGSTTRFNPSLPTSDPNAFKVFTPADGLNCCVQSMYQDRSGRMWWGTGQGLYRFDDQGFYQVKKQGPW